VGAIVATRCRPLPGAARVPQHPRTRLREFHAFALLLCLASRWSSSASASMALGAFLAACCSPSRVPHEIEQ